MKEKAKLFCLCKFTCFLLCFLSVGVNASVISPQSPLSISGYENTQTKTIGKEEFLNLLIELINEERSYKGLLPLVVDTIATQVATEQASDLLIKGYLSYYNQKNQCPDERYTLAGGTGVIMEIMKGFEIEVTEKSKKAGEQVRLTELLARQLLDAVLLNPDDSQILLSSYVTHIGSGISLSADGRKFVSVIEFITKGGEFEPLKPLAGWGEKINISGKVTLPFTFKAVAVAYFDETNESNIEAGSNDFYFDNENIKPYFPPQNYIAYGDTAKSNFLKVIKGLGFIGAIGAAPFTGGASAVLAPVILSSIQSGPPKEIPLKRGIKVNSKGEFSGWVDLNYQGMSGLYFVSILADLPSLNYSVPISRRTVRVRGLQISDSKVLKSTGEQN